MSLVRTGLAPVPRGSTLGFDHADVHRAGRRLYVAHTGADRVDVLDCERRAFLCSLPDLPGVAGVLVDEEHDVLCTGDRGATRVSVFRGSDDPGLVASFDSERLEHVETIDTELGAHTSCWDPVGRRLYVFCPASCGTALFEDSG